MGFELLGKGENRFEKRGCTLRREEEKMKRAKEAAGPEPLLKIVPFKHKKIALVTTGSEVKKGLIKANTADYLLEFLLL